MIGKMTWKRMEDLMMQFLDTYVIRMDAKVLNIMRLDSYISNIG